MVMASLGKSIDLYLMDGTASGRWQATLSNWNCVSYKIPRGDLKNCNDLPELHAPGVYFYLGETMNLESCLFMLAKVTMYSRDFCSHIHLRMMGATGQKL